MNTKARRNNVTKTNRSWLDIGTAVWAIALVLVATTWMATPAFAGFDEGALDCGQCCAAACAGEGGCASSGGDEGGCSGSCMSGETWEVYKPSGGGTNS